MKKLLIALLFITILIPAPLMSASAATELSGCMYGSLSGTASLIGGMRFDGDWYYANDIEVAYIGGGVTLAGNTADQVKFIMLDGQNQYTLYGLQVGMDKAALQSFYGQYSFHTFEDNGENIIFTLSERSDGYVEILWVVVRNDRLTHVIYEVGYGHD